MLDNTNNSTENKTQWWAKLNLRDISFAVGGIGLFYLQVVGGLEGAKKSIDTINAKVDKIELQVKETNDAINKISLTLAQEFTQLRADYNSLNERVKKLEENEKNNNYSR